MSYDFGKSQEERLDIKWSLGNFEYDVAVVHYILNNNTGTVESIELVIILDDEGHLKSIAMTADALGKFDTDLVLGDSSTSHNIVALPKSVT